MILSENRFPLFGIMLAVRAGADHSDILLVLTLAADDVGDIALVLVGFEEGVVFGRALGGLNFLFLTLHDRFLLSALGFGIRILEGHEFDFGRLRRLDLGNEGSNRRDRRAAPR